VSNNETRFAVAGKTVASNPPYLVVRTGDPWRLAWVALGIYDDGWTKPGVTTRVRVYPAAGQTRALTRYLTFLIRPPFDVQSRPVSVASNLATWHGNAVVTGTTTATVRVCVPPRGYAVVRLRASGASPVPGGVADATGSSVQRVVGVSLRSIALSDDVGGPCRT